MGCPRWQYFCVFSRYFECLLYPNGMWRHFNRSTIYIAPLSEGAPWRCRLGCEHDTLRLLLLRPHAGTQPIRPTCTPVMYNAKISPKIVGSHYWLLGNKYILIIKEKVKEFWFHILSPSGINIRTKRSSEGQESLMTWLWWATMLNIDWFLFLLDHFGS